jgi:aconitate hydratase
MMVPPLPPADAKLVQLEKTPNITTLPKLGRLGESIKAPVLLKVGDDISTDDIIPAGARVMPFWSNIPKVSEFAFEVVDGGYSGRARQRGAHVIVAGNNYGQGSSRENAALSPRYLGLQCVLAKSFARIHWQNLVNFGVLPLTFAEPFDYEALAMDDVVEIAGIAAALISGINITASVNGKSLH